MEYEDILKEKDQEKRFEMILTDVYGEDEIQQAFCCYIEDYISFPFEAKIREEKDSKKFKVLRFTSITPHRVVCEVEYEGRIKSRMPLIEIKPADKGSSNNIT